MPCSSLLNINTQRWLRASQFLTTQLTALWHLQSNYISFLTGFVTGLLCVCVAVLLCICSPLWCLFDVRLEGLIQQACFSIMSNLALKKKLCVCLNMCLLFLQISLTGSFVEHLCYTQPKRSLFFCHLFHLTALLPTSFPNSANHLLAAYMT